MKLSPILFSMTRFILLPAVFLSPFAASARSEKGNSVSVSSPYFSQSFIMRSAVHSSVTPCFSPARAISTMPTATAMPCVMPV